MAPSNALLAPDGTRSARQIADLVHRGEASAVEIVTECLERITAVEDEVHAWAFLDPELALTQARIVDASPVASPSDQPLRGVPVGIKDLIDTADQPTSYGSPIYATHQPSVDAQVVARLRRAGAIIVGKTVTTEFALFAPGPTVNPHDPQRTPGGSSSGSAAAVAAGMVPLALGTQTAGSVVRPASFCGVYGLKPTFGRYPTAGIKACAPSLDTVGVFARDPDDLLLADQALSGQPPVAEGEAPLSTARIGFCPTDEWSAVEPATQQAIAAALERIYPHVDVTQVALPPQLRGLVDAQMTVMAAEVWDALTEERERHAGLLSPQLAAYLATADERRDAFDTAQAHAEAARNQIGQLFRDCDVLLAPSTVGEPPSRDTTGDPLLCRMWTLLGVPVVAVPGLVGSEGLPVGLQVVGRPGQEAAMVTIASAVAEWLT